ncbi:MAG TPA: hypothetical protein VL147_18205 [Devosia sp.]|nr:hypothetical protein [Devosia sp.]
MHIADEDTSALKYSRTKKMTELTTDELRYTAAKALLPEKLVIDSATETVQRSREGWEAEREKSASSRKAMSTIDTHSPSVPRYRELS